MNGSSVVMTDMFGVGKPGGVWAAPAGAAQVARAARVAAARTARTLEQRRARTKTVSPGASRSPAMRTDSREIAAIFVGGFVGAVARAELDTQLASGGARWPWATFVVNIGGAFLLGWFVTRLHERLPLSAYRRPFLGTGLCGALTTFSTMQLELLRMLDGSHVGLAAAYAAASLAVGFVAVAAATNLVRRASLT